MIRKLSLVLAVVSVAACSDQSPLGPSTTSGPASTAPVATHNNLQQDGSFITPDGAFVTMVQDGQNKVVTVSKNGVLMAKTTFLANGNMIVQHFGKLKRTVGFTKADLDAALKKNKSGAALSTTAPASSSKGMLLYTGHAQKEMAYYNPDDDSPCCHGEKEVAMGADLVMMGAGAAMARACPASVLFPLLLPDCAIAVGVYAGASLASIGAWDIWDDCMRHHVGQTCNDPNDSNLLSMLDERRRGFKLIGALG